MRINSGFVVGLYFSVVILSILHLVQYETIEGLREEVRENQLEIKDLKNLHFPLTHESENA